jgi:hypothetical protein
MERRTEKQESTRPAAPDNNQTCPPNRDKARSGLTPLENLQEEERRGALRCGFFPHYVLHVEGSFNLCR